MKSWAIRDNTGRSVFPGGRPAYELGDAAVGYGLITIVAVIVVFLWGGGTLARFRYTCKRRYLYNLILTNSFPNDDDERT